MAFEPQSGQNHRILTQRFMSAGQWDRSLASAMEWLSREPENLSAHRAAAQSLVNLDRTEEAVPHLQKVLAGNPNDGFAHRLMAIVHFKAGRFRLADESIHRAISLNPTDANHWHQLAHMSYRQGDLATARKSVAKARELNPNNAEILNLSILCEPDQSGTPEQKIQKFKNALALDPENAYIHNNIGMIYLNRLNDYAQAEECFRRALFFQPAVKIFRQNLFLTVKRRDLVYRVLRAPKDWLVQAVNFFGRTRKQNVLLYILMIPLWVFLFRYFLVGLILWFILVWPLMKVYEFLTIGDIRARAGELGVQRGGFLGYRKWPVKVRLSIFAFFLISFWGGIVLFCMGKIRIDPNGVVGPILGIAFFLGLLFFLGYFVTQRIKREFKARSIRKRSRQMEKILNSKRETQVNQFKNPTP